MKEDDIYYDDYDEYIRQQQEQDDYAVPICRYG